MNRLDEEFTSIIESKTSTPRQRAEALLDRARIRSLDSALAHADFDAFFKLAKLPPELRAAGHLARGQLYLSDEEDEKAIDECRAASGTRGAPPNLVAESLVLVAILIAADDEEEALANIASALKLRAEAPAAAGRALVLKGQILSGRGDREAEERCYREAEAIPETPAQSLGTARYNIACYLANDKRDDEAILAYTRCIETPEIPDDPLGEALNNRGELHRNRGRIELALADFDACINLDEANINPRCRALVNRAGLLFLRGDVQDGLIDLEEAFELEEEPDAPLDQIARGYVIRGAWHFDEARHDEARDDFTRALSFGSLSPQATKDVEERLERL
jgi:tetratricopeptide (TPR) repeat protein